MPTITIQKHKFEVPEGILAQFTPGASIQLDEGTASTLRQVLCENLRNNFAGKVKEALNGSEQLPEEKFNELQTSFNEYAASYKFGVRGTRGERTVVKDPLERTMIKLAKEDITKAYKARHGAKIEKEALDNAVNILLTNKKDEYTRRARAILRETDRVSEGALEAAGL